MNTAPQKTKGTPDSVDVHVGQRLRMQRSLMGLSQEKLATSVGLTFQQIQKYERGTNRISAGRLYNFSKILNVPITYFFDQIAPENQNETQMALCDNEQDSFNSESLFNNKETLDLLRVYYSIEDPEMRKDIFKFMKSMAERVKTEETNS